MKTQKNDFVEIEFIGRVKEGDIFDTNIKSEAEKIGLNIESNPLIVCIGQEMLIKGFDEAVEDKEINKKYTIELEQEKAFGKRRKELVRLIPLNVFTEKKVQPKPGMTLALDNNLVRIASVSGGRVLCDFNNPLAGKEIIYEFTIKRKSEDVKEKINSIIDFFIMQKVDFEIKEKKVIFKVEKFFQPIIAELNKKFQDILGMEMIIEEKEDNKIKKIN